MITISRIDLADLTTPERIAGAIIREISDLPIPVPWARTRRARERGRVAGGRSPCGLGNRHISQRDSFS